MEYGKQWLVTKKLSRAEQEAVKCPVRVEESLRRFHAALKQHAPRVQGSRPDRLPYINSGGEMFFANAQEAESNLKAAKVFCKALGLNVALEISPSPNPAGGSPLYRILGYLAKEPGQRAKWAVDPDTIKL